jgi:soluble lytic murein transglycosylase-like protein
MRSLAFVLALGVFGLGLQANTKSHAESPLEFLLKKTAESAASSAAGKIDQASNRRKGGLRSISRTVSSNSGSGGNSGVAVIIRSEAARQGVPTSLAIAVARTESGLRCRAVGRAGELGPFQIKPATARGIGYRGPISALNSCGAGITYGLKHLAIGYRKCGTHSGAAALHNGGLGASCRATAYTRRVASRY